MLLFVFYLFDLEVDLAGRFEGQNDMKIAYISLIIDFGAYISMVSVYIMIYCASGAAVRFDLDLISQGQFTKWLIFRLLLTLELTYEW